MKERYLLAFALCFLAGCTTPFTVSPNPLPAEEVLSIAQSSPRWGHMKKGEAVQTIQDVYRALDRVTESYITATRMEVTCILDYRDARPTREIAFDWSNVREIAVYRQDWDNERMTYDINVRYTATGKEDAPVHEYGIGHTLSGRSFTAAQAADILCALYELTGKASNMPPVTPAERKERLRQSQVDVEFRLQRIKKLHEDGLIADDVLKQKQAEILKDL